MHKKLCSVFITILVSWSLSNLVIAEDNIITISAEDDAAPWSQKDGSGYANELVMAIFEAVGKKVKLDVTPYARCKYNVTSKKVQGCFNMVNLPEFKDNIIFSSIPLFIAYISYYHNPNNQLPVNQEEQLPKNTKIGTVVGYEYSELFHKWQKEKYLNVEETVSETQNLKKVAMQRIQGTILWHNETKPAEAIIKKAGVEGKVVFAFTSKKLELHIGFSKDDKGMETMKLYEQGYDIIKKNGIFKKITDQWINKAMSP